MITCASTREHISNIARFAVSQNTHLVHSSSHKREMSHIISLSLAILVIFVASIQAEDASTTSPPTTTAGNICKICECSGDKPKIVDCTDRKLDAIPDASVWPTNVDIEARMDHNLFTHIKPLGSIPGITRLSLSYCRVTVIEELAFQELGNLTFLDLSNNQLTTDALTPNIFKGHYAPDGYMPLKSLKVLHLGYNSLHSLDQDLFEHLTYLTELSLKSNPFKVLDHQTIVAISSLDYLKVLDLSYTSLSTLPEGSLHTPRFLVELDLQGNLFKEVPTQALADTHGLQVLSLDDNPIRVLDNVSFPSLEALERLTLSFLPNLTRIGEKTFANMRSLKELIITDNKRLEFIHPDAFKDQYDYERDQWTLKHLYLKNNQFGVLPRDLIKRWNALETLTLENNPWVCDCENQWMLDELMHLLDSMNSNHLVCEEPVDMRGRTMQELSNNGYHLQCVDTYSHHSERDGAILVGMLIGVLLAVPLTIAVVALWRRFGPTLIGRHPAGPADFSRAFYKRADRASTISYEHA
ncbi:hypothetical protein B566_EDAN001806 [Ephemera danica]|nr:hypothetical protein B566_EDAN001806 [Ephemera danica]